MIPHEYLVLYLGANAVALGILGLACWRPRWARWLWVAIFVWAAVVNTRTVLGTPYVYLVYGALTPSDLYRSFIYGPFSHFIQPMVLSIAAGQLMVAILLAGGARARRLGAVGAAVFLLAIAPLGVGSGFPFSLFAVASLLVIDRRLSGRTLPGRSAAARFIPRPDVQERHQIVVGAPAALVFETAAHADVQSLPLVRAIFQIRSRLLGDSPVPRKARGLVSETLALGWGVLEYVHERVLVMGASARPWETNVTFDPIPPELFRTFRDPGLVKIVWTLEVEPLAPALTRFTTDTRVEATDAAARRKFRWYWRAFGLGVVLIRVMLLRAIKREAERRYRERRTRPLATAA